MHRSLLIYISVNSFIGTIIHFLSDPRYTSIITLYTSLHNMPSAVKLQSPTSPNIIIGNMSRQRKPNLGGWEASIRVDIGAVPERWLITLSISQSWFSLTILLNIPSFRRRVWNNATKIRLSILAILFLQIWCTLTRPELRRLPKSKDQIRSRKIRSWAIRLDSPTYSV